MVIIVILFIWLVEKQCVTLRGFVAEQTGHALAVSRPLREQRKEIEKSDSLTKE